MSYCLLVKALDNTRVFESLRATLRANIQDGHFTVIPCKHQIPCREITDRDLESLLSRCQQAPDGDGVT